MELKPSGSIARNRVRQTHWRSNFMTKMMDDAIFMERAAEPVSRAAGEFT
jgi:hypothetical protein